MANLALEAQKLQVYYGSTRIIHNLSLSLTKGKIYSIIGPNGCGKSTLIKALSRNLSLKSGQIIINNRPLESYHTKVLAREMTLLPQSPKVPDQFTVQEVVSYGRFPHSPWSGTLSERDHQIVNQAMAQTDVVHFAHREMSHLSGGERQRVWIAMALAQEADLLLLDEPTTFLDISHQYQTLELISRLNGEGEKTILMVLHDLNQAARYSDHIFVMKEGELLHQGPPDKILTKEILSQVFSMEGQIIHDKENGVPFFIPHRGV